MARFRLGSRIRGGGAGMLLLLAACSDGDPSEPGPPPAKEAADSIPVAPPVTADDPPSQPPPESDDAVFVWRRDVGLDFRHHRFTTPEKKYLPETAGSGVALFDYDVDGDLDVYLVQCRPLPGYPEQVEPPTNRLFRNDGGLQFTDVTDEAGVGDAGYGMGATCPDIDNDGLPDLFVTNLRENVLYRNLGNGKFEDVFARLAAEGAPPSPLQDPEWSTAAGWADFDADGDLDLYLANYALCDFENYNVCSGFANGEKFLDYCHPDTLKPSEDRLFRNDGDFQFTDMTESAGIVDPVGKGLAVVPFDHDDNGRIDLFIANDSNENYLWINHGDWKFTNEADLFGVSVSSKGSTQACMGTDIADFDGDLDFDIFAANFGKEPNVLYQRQGPDFYDDVANQRGLGEASYLFTGFGADFFDFDRDADLDLMVLNGHILEMAALRDPSQTFEQVAHFYENLGDGRFQEIGSSLGSYFRHRHVGRGLAVGDLDNDGDLDAIASNNDQPAALLENRPRADHRWIGLQLIGTESPRDAIGARVTLTCGDKVQVEEVRGSTSYLSWLDLRLFFGLGDRNGACSAEIRWPSGAVQTLSGLESGKYHVVTESR